MRVRTPFVLALLALAPACAKDAPSAVTSAARVVVTPDTLDLEQGSQAPVAAQGFLNSGAILTGAKVTWASADSAIASVSSTGEITAMSTGATTITATIGSAQGSSFVRVSRKSVASVTVTPDTATLAPGQTLQLSATTRDAQGKVLTGRVITWASTSAVVATVTSTGLVSAVASGTAGIVATSEGKADTARITVATPPPPPPPPPPSGTVADPTQLPIASRQLPAFERYTGASLHAGDSYLDPVSGVRVWKATDAATPVANSAAAHDYASGAVQVSHVWGNNQHTILVNVSGHYLVDFTRGVGFGNWRPAPPVNADLCFTFSENPSTPHIAYYVSGTTLHRYDTGTNTVADSGHFPKSFASITSAPLLWLQQDRNDGWFVMMPNDASAVIAWNAITDQTQVIRPGPLDEPHLDRDGRYIALLIGSTAPDWRIYDLQTQILGAPISKQTHLEALRSYFIASDPDLATGPQYYYDPATGTQVSTLTASQLSPDGQHRSGQWIQSASQLPGGSLLKQWYLWSGFEDGVVTPGSWTVASGQVYWTTPSWAPAYQKMSIGVQSVRQLAAGDPNHVARQLAPAASVAAMTEGSFYYDAAASRVYVWLVGGGSPSGAVELRAPGAVHDGIAFVRMDGSEVRFLAHHYSHHPVNYWDIPRATESPDGTLVLFTSNMNESGGRYDLFVVEVPMS